MLAGRVLPSIPHIYIAFPNLGTLALNQSCLFCTKCQKGLRALRKGIKPVDTITVLHFLGWGNAVVFSNNWDGG